MIVKNQTDEFLRIYGTYRGQVSRFLLARCRDPELAEDVLQETFVLVLRKLDKFDPHKGELRNWLFKIAQNCLRSELRRRYNNDEISDPEQLEGLVADGPSPEDMVDDKLMRAQLHGLIQDLPQSERDVLIACKVDGLTLKETAHRLGIANRTVSRKLFQALKILREQITKMNPPTLN